MTDEDINKWMDEAKPPQALPGGKGVVGAIHPPLDIDTKHGKSDGNTINVRLFLPEQFPLLHPKSNLAKILARYGCVSLRELIGKEVDVVEVGEMLWNIKVE